MNTLQKYPQILICAESFQECLWFLESIFFCLVGYYFKINRIDFEICRTK